LEYRQLGQTGLRVSAVSLGGIPLQRIPAGEAEELVRTAIRHGINFIDTARAYTDSESKIGAGLQGLTELPIIASKSMARTKEAMAADVAKSLAAMGLSRIDLYQLHNVKDLETLERTLAPDGAYAALLEAREKGQINHIGISSHVVSVLLAAVETGKFATVMVPYNAIENQAAQELVPRAAAMGLGVIAMKPLAGGALQYAGPALKYILGNPHVSTALVGMDRLSQVASNIQGAEGCLQSDERNQLEELVSKWAGRFCRRCEYCQPCPQGIDIPMIFILDGYHTRYGLQEWARNRYQVIPVKIGECVECGQCEERCPYGLPIREMLQECRARLE